MTKDDRSGNHSADRSGGSGSPDSAEDTTASAETQVMDGDEIATAETVLVREDEAPGESAQETEDGDRTQVVSESDETMLMESSPGADQAGKATRVLDETQVAPAAATGVGLAETRVTEEVDKTSPPPVEERMRDRQAARPDSAAKPAPSPPNSPNTPIDSERGLPPGMILFGEYEIVNVLGVGGMGEVYRAKHRRLEEHRAIKVMHAELATKRGASEFFYREAKALLAVRHPAVVHCHDLLSDDEGRVYLIMEMIEGIPLSKKMNDGPLSNDEVAILGARVAHGLTAAHRKGVIHRDLSPDNIVLPNGRVQEAKIIDFGIAKLLEDGEGTILDGFKGKLSYASPEQLGFFGGKIDGRSDFYSLGLVLVAAALGRPMGMGTTVVEAVDARRAFRKLPDELPIGLRSAIQPLLALDPKDRPEYVDRLFVGPGGIESVAEAGLAQSPSSSGVRSASPPSRAGVMAGAAGAAMLLLGSGVYLAINGGVTETSLPSGTATITQPSAELPVAPTRAASLVPPIGEAKEPVELAKPVEVAKVPAPRRPSASDRIKIIGLISNAKLALSENRLMTPANDNAFDRYQQVLKLDPSDERASQGLREIATRYIGLADRALEKTERDQAQSFLERAKRADPNHPGIAALEARLRP